MLGSVLSISLGRERIQNIEMHSWAAGCKDLEWGEIQEGLLAEAGLARSMWHQGCCEWEQGRGWAVCVLGGAGGDPRRRVSG